MLPKKCLYCERRFSKAEHLKRHQRSHTGERPYRCSQCNKSFSRSDVLIRHLKNHPQANGDEGQPSSLDVVADDQRHDPEKPISEDRSVVASQSEHFNTQSVIDPALQTPLEGYDRPSHPMPSGLDHLALLASQQNSRGDPMDATMNDATRTPLMPASENQDWSFDVSGLNHDAGYTPQRMASTSNTQAINNSSHSTPRFDLGGPLSFSRHNAMQTHMSPGMGGLSQDRSDMMPNELQNWFDQFDMESQMQSGIMQDFGNTPGIVLPQESANHSPVASCSQRSGKRPASPSPSVIIPNERFAKVQRCWPSRPSHARRLMLTLWRDAVSKPEDNLFSTANLTPEAAEQNRQCGSRWGLDDDCRDRLQAIFVTTETSNTDRFPEAFQSPEGLSPSSGRASTEHTEVTHSVLPDPANFPPAEIFDIGLDLYFRQFHPQLPFIHTETFTPKTAPPVMLLTMCLIGLTVLETKASRAFVRQAFPKALEKVSSELISSPRSEETRIDQMSSLASALLMLNLSEMTGDQFHQSQCQLLYTSVITTSQQHGFFSPGESQPLNRELFDHITDLDAKWKAWTRVESAKRLIVCLTMVDTWFSARAHTSPVMRLEDIQLVLPCDSALFQATSSTKWAQLVANGYPLCMPSVVLTSDTIRLPELGRTLDALGMNTILCLIRLRISENFHRLLSGTQRRAIQQSFVPWKTYAMDSRAKVTQSLVVQVMKAYGPMLSSMNPNCLTLWHNMNIMLLADVRMFEIGAGCSGAILARQALDDISLWTKTSAARRACIHAGQTFKLLSNRRASDGDPFHASGGLFVAALILGLYVFMLPVETEVIGFTSSGFDLTDEVDWKVVGNAGLVSQNENIDVAAVNFIRNGGKIRFDGVIHEPGYNSARRILLDYARLLEDIGRWRIRVKQFSRVLRIMSDALVDVDMSGQ